MRMRCLLFVPGDRPERFAKAAASGADALILDLEDSVTPDRKATARGHVADRLAVDRAGPSLWVRINPLDSGLAEDDLAAVLAARPDGIVLPKSDSGESLRRLDGMLTGSVRILPITTETPAAIFGLGRYGGVTERLAGLTWGAEDLPAAVGAATSREADGRFTPPYEMARSLVLFGAGAAGVPAIETVYPDFRDIDGLAAYAARGWRDGFTGMMAIHPAQVPVINAAFTPTPEAVAHARRVLDAFASRPGEGAVQLDGRMIDTPHLKQARRIVALVSDPTEARQGVRSMAWPAS